jgi:hypothetical protein
MRQISTVCILAALVGGGCGSGSGPGGAGPAGFSTLYQTVINTDFDLVPAIFSIRGSSPSDVWVTGQFGTGLHYTGGKWTISPTTATGSVADLTGVTATNAYAFDVVANDMYQWNGHEWNEQGGASSGRFGIWSDSLDSVWGVGETQEHWNGTAWSPVATDTSFFGYLGPIDGHDVSSMFAIVEGGGIATYDGAQWTSFYSGNTTTLYALWVDSPTDVWFVGVGGLILHWDGAALTTVDGGTGHDLAAVTGTGPDDVWVAGDAGTVIHFDGTSWSYATTPSGQDINCAWSPHANEVWLGDVSGAVIQYIP